MSASQRRCILSFVVLVSAFLVGCAHKREMHYPGSSGIGSEPPLINSDTAISDKGKGSSSQARRSASNKANSSQARLDSADDPDRFDIDQVRE